MDMDQFHYFQVIAKYGNLSRAQEELHVAQPALSSSLARMEKHLGVPLFDRYKGRLRLNAYGQIFLRCAETVDAAYRATLEELAREKKRGSNTLSLALLDWGFAPGLIPNFVAAYPEISVNSIHVSAVGATVDDCVERYDMAIAPFPTAFSNAERLPLTRDELSLAVPPSHPLYAGDSARLADLDGARLLCPGMQVHFGQFITDLLDAAHVHPTQMEGCTAENMVDRMNAKSSVAFVVPGILRRMGPLGAIRLLPLTPPVFRASGLAYAKGRALSPAAKQFLAYAIAHCAALPNALADAAAPRPD